MADAGHHDDRRRRSPGQAALGREGGGETTVRDAHPTTVAFGQQPTHQLGDPEGQSVVATEEARRTAGREGAHARPHDLDAGCDVVERRGDPFERTSLTVLVAFDDHHLGTPTLSFTPSQS